MTIMVPGMDFTVKVCAAETEKIGGSSFTEHAVKPPVPELAANLLATLSQKPTALSDARFTGM